MGNKMYDVNEYPLHMQGDIRRHNKLVEAGKPICERCDGTGNQLFSMYQKCAACNGDGVQPKKIIIWKCPNCGFEYHPSDMHNHLDKNPKCKGLMRAKKNG